MIAGREGAQGVLDAISELAEDGVRNVERILSDEIDANTFRTNQADELNHFVLDDLGQIGEEQVSFVKKENQLGLFWIARFRQVLKQIGEHPQQERRVQLGRLIKLVGGEDVDDSAAIGIGLHPIVEIESGLAEEFFAALLLNREQAALDGADAGRGDVSVLRLKIFGVIADLLQHGLQIFQVEKKQTVVVGDFEDKGENAFLDVVEIEQTSQEEWAHFGDRGSDGMTLFAKNIPNVTGQASNENCESFSALARSVILGLSFPGWLIPDKSPLISAANTGTPIRLKASAITWSVTVLPVPVAPATRPWRLAI